jgi:hypothetical protein
MIHTVWFFDSTALFTNKVQYLGKNEILKLLPGYVSALLSHFQGMY